MKRFLIKVCFFLLLCVMVDYAIAFALKQFRPLDYKAFIESKSKFFKKQKSYDVVFIGNSQISDAAQIPFFEQRTGLKAFNIGIYHSSPFDNYFVLKKMIQKEIIPQYIVISTNPEIFYKTVAPSQYIPSILDDRMINIQMNRAAEIPFNGLCLLKYQNERYLTASVMRKITRKPYIPARIVEGEHNGYLEFYNQIEDLEWGAINIHDTRTIKTQQVEYLHRTIELAQKHQIQVILSHMPFWKEKQIAYEKNKEKFQEFNKIIQETKKKYRLKIFNESYHEMDDLFEQRDFQSPEHLNGYGAKKWTERFSEWFIHSSSDLRRN